MELELPFPPFALPAAPTVTVYVPGFSVRNCSITRPPPPPVFPLLLFPDLPPPPPPTTKIRTGPVPVTVRVPLLLKVKTVSDPTDVSVPPDRENGICCLMQRTDIPQARPLGVKIPENELSKLS
jgi:hypothetical protein